MARGVNRLTGVVSSGREVSASAAMATGAQASRGLPRSVWIGAAAVVLAAPGASAQIAGSELTVAFGRPSDAGPVLFFGTAFSATPGPGIEGQIRAPENSPIAFSVNLTRAGYTLTALNSFGVARNAVIHVYIVDTLGTLPQITGAAVIESTADGINQEDIRFRGDWVGLRLAGSEFRAGERVSVGIRTIPVPATALVFGLVGAAGCRRRR